jgi:transcriptional regulator of acetoin/glycerol metabolism
VLAALRAAGGVKSTAAKRLGIHRTQFYRLLERYGIDDD